MSGESQIVSELNQLRNINKEIKRIGVVLKELRDKKAVIEERVLKYLEKTKRTGAKTLDIEVEAKEKVKRPSKSKTEKQQDVSEVLRKVGIRDTESTYAAILDAMKGEETVKPTLVIKEKKEGSSSRKSRK